MSGVIKDSLSPGSARKLALIRRRRFEPKFTIGDMVTMHTRFSVHHELVGAVVGISADPDDNMPYIVDWGEGFGQHRFTADELKVARLARSQLNK